MCTSHPIDLYTRRFSVKDNWHLDVEAYESLRPHLYKENLTALAKIRLGEPVCTVDCNKCQHQYLDVGCGPGNFTKEVLMPLSCPKASRIVAVDRSRRAVEYAKVNFPHSRIAYDQFDVEDDDFTAIFQRYGPFDRIYSFFTFHYVADVARAYRNVAELLKPGGDCLVLSITGGDAIDVWDAVYRTEEWGEMINPRELFPGMYRCGGKNPTFAQMEDETKNCVSEAGLHCVSYEQYETRWKFGRMEDYLDTFMASFNAYSGVPQRERTAFRDLWMELMLQKTRPKPGGPVDIAYTLNVVHTRRPGAN